MVKGVVVHSIIKQEACQNKRSPRIRDRYEFGLALGTDCHCHRSEAISEFRR